MIRFGPIELPDPFKRTRQDPDIALEFRSLSTKDKAALAAFFKVDARGMREEWDYTDSNGTKRVRFNESSLVFVQFAADSWDVSLVLIIA